MTELLAALVGGLVGGGLALLAGHRQTRHATEQAREAADQARRAARHAVSRTAVQELLRVLAEVEQIVPNLGSTETHPGTTSNLEGRSSDHQALDLLSRAHGAHTLLLPGPVQTRWAQLGELADELHAAQPIPAEPPGRADWTDAKVTRARSDVSAYLAYVRRTLVALINEQDLPADAAAPILRRMDMAVWLAPDEGGPSR